MGIIETLVNSLTEFITGSASAIGDAISNLLFTTEGDTSTLSVAGIVILTMLGIGFAVGLMRVVFSLIRA